MGISQDSNTVVSKTEDFININQRITLPENYKKFSTIKLRIKPAKLIFVNSGGNSNNIHNSGVHASEEYGQDDKDKHSDNDQESNNGQQNLKLDPAFLFGSGDCLLSMDGVNEIKNSRTLSRKHCCSDYQENKKRNVEQFDGDSEIVKDLVLDKFKDLLQKLIERANRRRIFSTDQEDHLGGWSDYMHFLDPFAVDFHNIDKEFRSLENENVMRNMKNVECRNEQKLTSVKPKSCPCNEDNDHGNVSAQETEMILNHICSSTKNHFRKEHHPSYVHISEPMETAQALHHIERKTETIDNLSIVTYTSDDEDELSQNEQFHYETKLRDEINEQRTAVSQVLKVLSLCETNKKLSESVLRVEAEKVLLVASLRKNILTEALVRYDKYNQQEKNGFVLLSNLKIAMEPIDDKKSKTSRIFICIFRCGTTVFCSDLLMLNQEKELEIDESFCFEELSTGFSISVEIYSMQLKLKQKSTGRKILQKYRNLLFGMRTRFRNTPEIHQKEEGTTRKSAFVHIGKTLITRPKLQCREFSIENKNTQNIKLKQLNCNIGSGVKLDIFLSGFLMVSESCGGKTKWRRQWCILDASELKFWDYPGKEETTDPNRIIDLSRSLLPYIMLADRKFCSRPRSLHLKIGPDSTQEEFYHKDIFLAADNPRDFLFWEKELNRVLKNLINWGCMKTYFENSL